MTIRLFHSAMSSPGPVRDPQVVPGRVEDPADAAADHLQALPGAPVPAGFASRDDALAWLDAERPSLVGAVMIAADMNLRPVALNLPIALEGYLSWRRRWDDTTSTAIVSLNAARDVGDRLREGIRGRALREFAGSRRRSPHIRKRWPSFGKPATSITRAKHWTISK